MIVGVGEILVDLIGRKNNDILVYNRMAGGAVFNVCCGINKYGGNVSFIGNVGDDLSGKFLVEYAKDKKFNNLFIDIDKKHNTTLAFVENDEFGERSFSFQRKNAADYNISDINFDIIKKCNIVHLGSLMLSERIGREVADKVINIAKENNIKISFDVNFRSDIYDSIDEANEILIKYMKQCDIIKFSEDEILQITNSKDIKKGIEMICSNNQIVFVTLGKEGSALWFKGEMYYEKSISVNCIDTTGCGDAFFAGILYKLDLLNEYKKQDLIDAMKFANISGALVATKLGAIDSLPTKEEILKYL